MITDEMIAEAAAKYNDALIQYWQNVEMEEHEFSSKFERKMRRLIWKVKYPYMHKALRSVACILIAFLISFASVLTFNVEARAAFTRWIREVYEDSIVYEFFGDRSETASLDYRVTWVPDGYELVDEYKSEVLYSLLYQKENDSKETFVVEWFYVSDTTVTQVFTNAEDYRQIEVMVSDNRADYYQSLSRKETNNLIWINENDVCFAIDSYLDFSTIKKIAESIKK